MRALPFPLASSRPPSLAALGLVVMCAPIATDAYLVALPSLGRDLHAAPAAAQLTLTVFLVAFAAGQLFGGAAGDRAGRRPMLLAGLALFVVASAGTAVTPTLAVLLAARSIQGLAVGTAAANARAAVADRWTGVARTELLAVVFALLLAGPVFAPLAGGLLLNTLHWRGVMAISAVLGTAALIATLLRVPETRRSDSESRASGPLLALRSGSLRQQLAVGAVAAAANFVYVGASPFILRAELGLSAATYGLAMGVNGFAMVAAALLARRTAHALPLPRMQRSGLLAAAASCTALALAALLAHPPVLVVEALLVLFLAGSGFASVATGALVQAAAPRSPGAAAGLSGALTFMVGALAIPAVGLIGTTLAITALAMTIATVAAVALGLQPHRCAGTLPPRPTNTDPQPEPS